MAPKLRFEVVTDPACIGKRELGMLVQMMEDLNHSGADGTKKAYGYNGPDDWNEEQLQKYKSETLTTRMRDKNYTFFLLKDKNGETVALASGNAPHLNDSHQPQLNNTDHKQLRIMNVTVASEHRGNGYASELMKRLAHHAKKHGFENIVIPLSPHALAKGNDEIYKRIMDKLGIGNAVRPHSDPEEAANGHVELVVTPKRFVSLDMKESGKVTGPCLPGNN